MKDTSQMEEKEGKKEGGEEKSKPREEIALERAGGGCQYLPNPCGRLILIPPNHDH